jgi:hypothetical protein
VHAQVGAWKLIQYVAIMMLAMHLLACGGGPTLMGNVLVGRQTRYRIGELGPSWRRLSVAGDNDLAFHHEGVGAIIQVNATCDPASDVPLTALTNHLLIGFTDRDIQEQSLLPMDEREALRTHVIARLDGVPRELLFYVMKKNACVYDFALITPPGENFALAAPDFERFRAGFSTETAR